MDYVLQDEARSAGEALNPFLAFLVVSLGFRLPLKMEQREGFTAPMRFYLFRCAKGHFAKSYAMGYVERRYLRCSLCGLRHDFRPWWLPIVKIAAVLKVFASIFWGRFFRRPA